jgi:DNA-binding NtrC family response regulator
MESILEMPANGSYGPLSHAFLLANLKILIAEDESLLAWELKDMLGDWGNPKIFWSASIKGAREILTAHEDIALVLLDLKLQDGSGEELLRELTERDMPLIVVTGYSLSVSRNFPVLIKPYTAEALIVAIKKALAIAPS